MPGKMRLAPGLWGSRALKQAQFLGVHLQAIRKAQLQAATSAPAHRRPAHDSRKDR